MSMAELNAEKRAILFRKIAEMTFSGLTQRSIGEALEVSEGTISRVLSSEEYKSYIDEHIDELDDPMRARRMAARANMSIDAVEAMAWEQVLEAMSWKNDPEFALKVAQVANKSERRGRNIQPPTDGDGNAVTVTLTLTSGFVNKLQGREDTRVIEHAEETKEVEKPVVRGFENEQHKVAVMPQGQVERIMQKTEERRNPMAALVPDNFVSA